MSILADNLRRGENLVLAQDNVQGIIHVIYTPEAVPLLLVFFAFADAVRIQ